MIPGITTRNRMPRLGKIRLGEKRVSKGGKEYPAALDHFNFADVPEVEKVYGKDCREIHPVIILVEDEEAWFPTARKAYRRSGLFCACDDGETARRVYVPFDPKDNSGDPQGTDFIKDNGLAVEPGEMFEMPCPGESCAYFEQGLCKNVGRLLFMLPSIPRFGVYEISTSSYNSIVNVLSTARAIQRVAGRISGIPLTLVLGPQQVQAADGKAKTVHVLSLEFRGSIFELQRAKAELAGGRVVALLKDGKDLTPEDLYPAGGAALDKKLQEPKAAPPPKQEPAAVAPGAGNGNSWTGVLSDVKVRSQGKTPDGVPWAVYAVTTADGGVFVTKEPDKADLAQSFSKEGRAVEIVYEQTPKGNLAIVSIEPAEVATAPEV